MGHGASLGNFLGSPGQRVWLLPKPHQNPSYFPPGASFATAGMLLEAATLEGAIGAAPCSSTHSGCGWQEAGCDLGNPHQGLPNSPGAFLCQVSGVRYPGLVL